MCLKVEPLPNLLGSVRELVDPHTQPVHVRGALLVYQLEVIDVPQDGVKDCLCERTRCLHSPIIGCKPGDPALDILLANSDRLIVSHACISLCHRHIFLGQAMLRPDRDAADLLAGVAFNIQLINDVFIAYMLEDVHVLVVTARDTTFQFGDAVRLVSDRDGLLTQISLERSCIVSHCLIGGHHSMRRRLWVALFHRRVVLARERLV
mmetsp:Transcript_33688/g.84000  ORF Transcript_33688/g.84000 Transcript_33688/m.84000 type:complete len:207 (+) Transcript_33688:1577-2197(+)